MHTHNVDPQEIDTFDEQASAWWDPQGAFKALHAINPLRLQFITTATPLTGKHIIDVGCGGGILSEAMAKQGAHVVGVDMSEKSLQAAQAHAQLQQLDLTYEHTTVEAKAEAYPHAFDIVTCMEILEHVPDPAAIIQACAKLVKPDGHLFFSTINRNPKAYLFAIIGAEHCLKLLPKGMHAYEKFIKPSELASWSRMAGVGIKDMAGIGYNPLTKEYRLTRDVSVNYLAHCQLEDGL